MRYLKVITGPVVEFMAIDNNDKKQIVIEINNEICGIILNDNGDDIDSVDEYSDSVSEITKEEFNKIHLEAIGHLVSCSGNLFNSSQKVLIKSIVGAADLYNKITEVSEQLTKEDEVFERINNYPTKYKEGLTQYEILSLIDFYDVDMDAFFACTKHDTFKIINKQTVRYHHDIVKAILKSI